MRIAIHGLVLTGPDKPNAELKPGGESHLVFGPTDTGKSYIEECIAYCLGGDEHPRNVGFSEGYTRAALQVLGPDGSEYTFFRDLLEERQVVYSGFHSLPPLSSQSPVAEEIGPYLIEWGKASGNRILVKAGTLGNVTANDLRFLSLFDEIRTLDKVPLKGKDKLLKMRFQSVIMLALIGVDDSGATLTVKTDQRNIAKGHVQAIEDELKALHADIPSTWSKEDCAEGLTKIEHELREVGTFLRTNAQELTELKTAHESLEDGLRDVQAELAEVLEAKDRFVLLDEKYQNDVHRLSSLITASEIVETFESQPCPLCRTDLNHKRNYAQLEQGDMLREAARAEVSKINALRQGLAIALSDIDEDIVSSRCRETSFQRETAANLSEQARLLRPASPNMEADYLGTLTARRTEMAMAARNFERIDTLNARLVGMKAKTKRQKQSISRDFSTSATELCRRISELLTAWGVPMVESVHFDEDDADIHINNRQRVSFGKGKRGIFLTALAVALMERALHQGNPHLGLIVIDSPVVTYKDPKHGSNNPEEALDPTVKDKFYTWLADRQESGQIIVLENEEPDGQLQMRLAHTEFVGLGEAEGRRGFFPI